MAAGRRGGKRVLFGNGRAQRVGVAAIGIQRDIAVGAVEQRADGAARAVGKARDGQRIAVEIGVVGGDIAGGVGPPTTTVLVSATATGTRSSVTVSVCGPCR